SMSIESPIGSIVAGRYQIVRLVGQGGMSTIFEVKHLQLGRSFALKKLSYLRRREQAVKRFRREAQIISSLHHPNLVEIIDWEFMSDGSPCMIMEFLHGEDLSTRLLSGPCSWRLLHMIADQILSALIVAHNAGCVHRDLKPA